jgi:TetR/AcrR family transcriptional regulator, regulator of biofilm formation and stress response
MRTAAGSERRAALLDAAIALIGRHGTGAVTHRSVAAAAGVPAATVGYYFTSRERLVDEALLTLAAAELEELRRGRERLGAAPTLDAAAAALAGWLLERATTGAVTSLARYQLAVETPRRPALIADFAAASAEADALTALALQALGARDPRHAAVTLTVTLDGLLLRLLTQPPDDHDAAGLRVALRVLLAGLVGAG